MNQIFFFSREKWKAQNSQQNHHVHAVSCERNYDLRVLDDVLIENAAAHKNKECIRPCFLLAFAFSHTFPR